MNELESQNNLIRTRYQEFPIHVREHMDMAENITVNIAPMDYPNMEVQKVKNCLKKLRNNKAPGPDKLKTEIYKVIGKNETCITVLTECLKNELEHEDKTTEWKYSKTNMIPKVKMPTSQELRPIALTNTSYKIFMSLIGENTEEHVKTKKERKENQAAFTEGGRIEDNLLILRYCIENSYKNRKALIIISIDFKKAFDSIKRGKMIEVLMKYKIHPKVIDAVASLYKEDKTKINIYDTEEEFSITSGIRQGCTGSTTIFKLITYTIIEELEKKGYGYKDEKFTLCSLFFADDGLILAHSVEDAVHNINILRNISYECGLEINAEKSSIIIHNMKNQPNEIEGQYKISRHNDR